MKTNKTRIKFEYEGEKYTLEYTAASAKKLEERGFDFFNAESRMLGASEDVFVGAFIENHDDVPIEKRVEIYHELCSEDETGQHIDLAVMAMVNEAINEIRSHKGNVKWAVTK